MNDVILRRTHTFVQPAALIAAAIALLILSGCSGTPNIPRIALQTPASFAPGFTLIDSRPADSRVLERDGNVVFLGDENFDPSPLHLIATRLDEKLGPALRGRQIVLLHFRARITEPGFQTYPGMPLAADIMGRLFKLPQLGYPHYAYVSLRGELDQKEFVGDGSAQFYLGSGEREMREAFDAALNDAMTRLQPLLAAGQ